MASAFLSQNCSSFTYERRPKNSPSIDELLHHVISHEIMITILEIMITSINGELSGKLHFENYHITFSVATFILVLFYFMFLCFTEISHLKSVTKLHTDV